MIPITPNTIKAVAALIYNEAYHQDPDTGWLADDPHSEPGDASDWLAWTTQLVQVLAEQPEATDEEVLSLAQQRMNVGHFWNTIWMQQTEDGDEYSTITEETHTVMPQVRDFLEEPYKYVEVSFIEDDPAYVAYLEAPLEA
jgi:hypothetical protein